MLAIATSKKVVRIISTSYLVLMHFFGELLAMNSIDIINANRVTDSHLSPCLSKYLKIVLEFMLLLQQKQQLSIQQQLRHRV